jgi:ribonuclease E
MTKRMLIDAAHPEETRVVVLDGQRIEDFDFESRGRKQLRGNIYLAKVSRVEPSLQAAFVEYGGNRHGFLAFNEIHPDYYQIPLADREALMRDADEEEGDDEDDTHKAEGEEDSEAIGGDDEGEEDEAFARKRRRLMRRYKIQDVIKRRQIMLVQVVKEERGVKGAALTTYLSLAGRYCVLMPNSDRGGGISRKIETGTDRKRLKTVVQDLDVPEGMGLIVRTAGAKRTKQEIKRDYEYLLRAWADIREKTFASMAPALVYEEEDLVKRAVRDLFDKDVQSIWVDGEAGYREARDFMRALMPTQVKKVQLHAGPAPLFVAHKIEGLLSQLYTPQVTLKSGGYLVINQTEALVAIDVNSGKATRERNIEATALKTNIEAAEEAARQIRLRDLAGLIIIDFIDMEESKNNRAVEKALKDALSLDRARLQVGRISPFGLMEISRQRRRSGILEGTTQPCPHCGGAGRVRSVESSALSALRAVEMEALGGGGEVTLTAPTESGLYILNHKRDYLMRLLHAHGLFVTVALDHNLSHADFNIERVSSIPFTPDPNWAPAGRAMAEPADEEIEDEEFFEDEEEEEVIAEAGEDADASGSVEEVSYPRERREGREDRRNGGRNRRRGRWGDRRDRGDRDERGGQTSEAPPASDETESEADARGRRRRGRRGGRRGRDEVGGDAYAWSWPARLSGNDPYEWRGPIVLDEPPPPRPAPPAPEPKPEPVIAAVTAEAPAVEEDIWVELPAAEPEADAKPKRRRRKRKDEAEAPEAVAEESVAEEAVAEAVIVEEVVAEPEAQVEAAPEPAAVEAEPAPEPAPEPEPAAAAPVVEEVVAEAPSEPPPPPEPDPNEIKAPPEKPKRGWWRRG